MEKLKRWAMGRSLQEKKVKINKNERSGARITERGLSALEGINWFRRRASQRASMHDNLEKKKLSNATS
jgi:hypothetical protein